MLHPIRYIGLPISLVVAGILFLGFGVDRTDFWQVMLGFITAFGGYFWLVKQPLLNQATDTRIEPHQKTTSPLTELLSDHLALLLGVGILIRFILLFAFPLLSDDIYRFLWDGYLLNAGISPFKELPAYYLEAGHEVPGLTQALFDRLNSPDYYTIYPPVAQATFTFATALSGVNNWGLGSLLMKSVLFAGELGSLWLLWRNLPRWGMPRANVLLYWLNPLIIIEICGNLHFEGLMVFFLLAALWLLSRNKIVYGALAFALSVAAKLLPLMLLPFLIIRLWTTKYGRNFWVFSLVFGSSLLLCFAPLISGEFLQNFGSSLDLYFRKFEFNASVYYLFRAYGYYEIGWNQIARFGPLLGKIAGGLILLLAGYEAYRRQVSALKLPAGETKNSIGDTLPKNYWQPLPFWWMLAFTTYLLLATTVHPWYLSIPIVLSCFTSFRYPIIWSFFIVLTYASYTTLPYQENYWLVGIEYSVVFILGIRELLGKRFQRRKLKS